MPSLFPSATCHLRRTRLPKRATKGFEAAARSYFALDVEEGLGLSSWSRRGRRRWARIVRPTWHRSGHRPRPILSLSVRAPPTSSSPVFVLQVLKSGVGMRELATRRGVLAAEAGSLYMGSWSPY